VNERGETTVPGLYAAGDMAAIPHNYLLGALTYGKICAENALAYCAQVAESQLDAAEVAQESARILAPLSRPHGIPHHQFEYKVRRLVNDYLQPPKSEFRMQRGLDAFMRASEEWQEVGAGDPHDLMRVHEGSFIRDCAELAARASLFRTESRWGLYHYRLDFPELDDARWFVHVNVRRGADGAMEVLTRPVADYVVPLDADERRSYYRVRIPATERAATELRS
jgi:succinate dehydrogenase/fumarate reductase flavoprotein subunit